VQEGSRGVERAALLLGLALLALVVGTGLWLTFNYRPGDVQAWNAVVDIDQTSLRLIRLVHRVAGYALVLPAGALVVVRIGDRRLVRAAAATFVGPLALAGTITGYGLAWDQLALWAVTVGTNKIGITPIFRDDVRFVLIGGVEISPTTYRISFGAHVTIALAVGAALILAGRHAARQAGTTSETQAREAGTLA
jgi:quinol-cytochrome oxidoreductase complex cytochrome b subunit